MKFIIAALLVACARRPPGMAWRLPAVDFGFGGIALMVDGDGGQADIPDDRKLVGML